MPRKPRKTKKPAAIDKLRAELAQAHDDNLTLTTVTNRLREQLQDVQRQSDSNARIALEYQQANERVHAILDYAPSAPRRAHPARPKTPMDSAALRLAGWLAAMHDRSAR